jgi:hypothetical protein
MREIRSLRCLYRRKRVYGVASGRLPTWDCLMPDESSSTCGLSEEAAPNPGGLSVFSILVRSFSFSWPGTRTEQTSGSRLPSPRHNHILSKVVFSSLRAAQSFRGEHQTANFLSCSPAPHIYAFASLYGCATVQAPASNSEPSYVPCP